MKKKMAMVANLFFIVNQKIFQSKHNGLTVHLKPSEAKVEKRHFCRNVKAGATMVTTETQSEKSDQNPQYH